MPMIFVSAYQNSVSKSKLIKTKARLGEVFGVREAYSDWQFFTFNCESVIRDGRNEMSSRNGNEARKSIFFCIS